MLAILRCAEVFATHLGELYDAMSSAYNKKILCCCGVGREFASTDSRNNALHSDFIERSKGEMRYYAQLRQNVKSAVIL